MISVLLKCKYKLEFGFYKAGRQDSPFTWSFPPEESLAYTGEREKKTGSIACGIDFALLVIFGRVCACAHTYERGIGFWYGEEGCTSSELRPRGTEQLPQPYFQT